MLVIYIYIDRYIEWYHNPWAGNPIHLFRWNRWIQRVACRWITWWKISVPEPPVTARKAILHPRTGPLLMEGTKLRWKKTNLNALLSWAALKVFFKRGCRWCVVSPGPMAVRGTFWPLSPTMPKASCGRAVSFFRTKMPLASANTSWPGTRVLPVIVCISMGSRKIPGFDAGTCMHTYTPYLTLHYNTLQYITLHYVTLRSHNYMHTIPYITLQYLTLQYITLQYIAWQYMNIITYISYHTIPYHTLHYITLTWLHDITRIPYHTIPYITLHYVALH